MNRHLMHRDDHMASRSVRVDYVVRCEDTQVTQRAGGVRQSGGCKGACTSNACGRVRHHVGFMPSGAHKVTRRLQLCTSVLRVDTLLHMCAHSMDISQTPSSMYAVLG